MELKIVSLDPAVEAELIGRLDTAASSQFSLDMQPLMDNADKTVILDFSQLEFISSSGLRLMLSLRKQTMTKGGKVVIKNSTPSVKQVFTITGFTNLFEFA